MNRIPRLLAALALLALAPLACGGGGDTVRIGTKNFTEQFLLGQMMKQVVEAHTGLSVDLRPNLGGTMICHDALASGEIDLYAEYTGTGLTVILEKEAVADAQKAFDEVSSAYEERFACRWLQPFGFNNTYAVTVRAADAEKHGWKTLSDLAADAADLRAGFTAEFIERPDGYPKLRKVYGLSFGSVRDLDPGLMYDAAVHDEVDVICAFATDGRIAAYDLVTLGDDRGVFPPYFAAPVVRRETLEAHPDLAGALGRLAGLLDDETMQKLNYRVDGDKEDPEDVARDFLASHDLVPSGR